jgi:hypothetical protein
MPEIQHITVKLEGITAGDYLAHQLDADPPAETSHLRSIALDVPDPLGDTIGAALRWDGRPPSARTAAVAAGFALTGDVTNVRSRVELRCGHARRRAPRLVAAAA